MAGRLQGKVAIVTGGASGIGLEICHAFGREGARVCVADLGQERSAVAAAQVGNGAFGSNLDVRDGRSIRELVAHVVAETGRIDVLVNSAGVFGMAAITDITEDEFERIFAVNTRGVLFVIQAVARRMIEQGHGGAIVNIASGAARRAAAGAAVYSASKAAVISITQSAAQELIAHGIRVNAIAPGAVLTPMWTQVEATFTRVMGASPDTARATQIAATPAGRMSTPQDQASAAVFLASAESAFVVGQTLNVDGGLNLN
jgi:D-sorbitol dehydrogenase (acceptor)